ncbi:MAG: UvrD-helicase domain-containing protein, partial [Alistipes sp.]|nr:UvrD-helicase domain-containing protein [Alistipes sp.]
MAPVWTKEQQQVIELHNRNILVSAAAGSGKTAVLVERILKMISDEEHPVDIDRLVIVTFTNAAAYEMKQRILAAIEKKMEEQPLNLNLRRQQTLVNHAQITTIDSFCLNIIRSYFGEIDLDPGFKVADEGELKLLMSDVLDELIEEYYQEGSPAFYDFVECYTPEKTDARLSDYILNLYRAAQSNPWPKEWLLSCKEFYRHETEEEFMKTPFMRFMTDEVRRQLKSVRELCMEMKEIAGSFDGPYMYLDALNDDLIFVESLISEENLFSGCGVKIKEHTFARLSSKKDASVNENKKDAVKEMRDTAKKALGKIGKDYLNRDLTELRELISRCFPAISVYVDMTIDFMERLDEKKRKKNLIHFSDMEHLALQLLVRKEGDKLCRTAVADELSEKYEEILIDEYQDSNLVQEIILNSISRERFGKPNVFMVGDVKQSIYRFRLARPELFIEKYDSYTTEESLYQKIELHKNFRSRESVLASVNEVFAKIMKREFGRIAYDDNAKLYAGMDFLPIPEQKREFSGTEVLVLEHEDESDMSDTEAEAVLCGDAIRRLIDDEEAVCFDKETGAYRKITYGDIVVLMRSAKQSAGIFVNTFAKMGIPAIAESDTGYFSAYEISVLLSLLNVIDNPRQDIHLTAVLKSYFGGLTGNDLAKIRALCPDKSFYEAFLQWEDKKKVRF